ncbi:MAG TPA: YjfB family protein [Mobilitalea sp.]|nr:YjfB family protein [Mobilitalea sp.]
MRIGDQPVQSNLPVSQTDVSIAVLSKNLDMIEQAGQSMIKMMEQSVQPGLGQNIDLKI